MEPAPVREDSRSAAQAAGWSRPPAPQPLPESARPPPRGAAPRPRQSPAPAASRRPACSTPGPGRKPAGAGLGLWSLYFLAKASLYYAGSIGFDWLGNLLFAAALACPLRWPAAQRLRRWLAWPLAVGLLYRDSFLPGPERLLNGLAALGGFSAEYLWELAARAVNPWVVLALAAGLGAYALLARWVPFTLVAFLGILSVPVMAELGSDNTMAGPAGAAAAPEDPQARLQAFYEEQARRKLQLPASAQPGFDLVVLHVCSLAWDDLDAVGERNHPLFGRFDLLLSDFNSAASYSGPAVLRLLYGACGQVRHGQLYRGAPRECQIFPVLEQAGFQTAGLLNHDGRFDDFAKLLEFRGGLRGKVQVSHAAPVHMRSFDGSPIYDDFAALSQWWRQRLRQGQGAGPAALYYNTVSLHDGNRVSGSDARNSLASYRPRLRKLLGDFDRFITQLERSGRPVVLVLVPEHGAALRGDRMQLAGMREIPAPRITRVPAAVKLVGLPARQGGGPLVVDQPTSYFDLNRLLADLVADNPYARGARPLPARLGSVGTTPFVAENEDVVVVREPAGGYRMRAGQGAWASFGG